MHLKSYSTKDFIRNDLTFIEPDISVTEIYSLMQKHRIRHIPVVENGKAVGIISDRDVRFVSHTPDNIDLTGKDIMTADPYSVDIDTPLGALIKKMSQKKIGSALIHNEQGKVIGIFTSSDALTILAENLDDE